MRRRLSESLASAIVLLAAATCQADLQFDRPQANIGRARSGTPLMERFAFVNRGPAAVTFTGLKTMCGCLAPRFELRTYQPGERGIIPIEINTLSQPAGPHAWRMEVHYQDGGEARVQTLEVLANLVTEIQVEPTRLAISTDRDIRHEIVVTDLRPAAFRVTHAQATSPHFAATVTAAPRVAGAPAVFRIAVDVKPTLPEGRHDEVLSILTDDPDYPELRVPVQVAKRGRATVTASPAAVTLIIPRGQAAPSRVVLLRSAGDEKVEVEKILSDDPAVSCRWAAGPDNQATLRITADATHIADGRSTIVRVHVRTPSPCVVAIPVTCVVR